MKINGHEVTAEQFAFDGCHKIYLLDGTTDAADAEETGYLIPPIEQLSDTYEDSCELRFISDWKLTKEYVSQFENALIEVAP